MHVPLHKTIAIVQSIHIRMIHINIIHLENVAAMLVAWLAIPSCSTGLSMA